MEQKAEYQAVTVDNYTSAAVLIARKEYNSYIETAARVDIIKNYILSESYPSVDVIKTMLGIDKTS